MANSGFVVRHWCVAVVCSSRWMRRNSPRGPLNAGLFVDWCLLSPSSTFFHLHKTGCGLGKQIH